MSKPNFFSNPYLQTLLSSHDIPAPVIYPPGSDPPSFLNHPLQVSMDADPCVVATRKETVAKGFDLTASEHAGVNFSQAATIVSKTSNYPTNSPDVDPPTVKDVFETISESKKNTQKFTGLSAINQETKSPVGLTVIKQETPSSVENDTSNQELEKKNQDLLQTVEPNGSLFVCNIPEPGVEYQKIVTVEVDGGSLFKNMVCNTKPVQASNGGTKNRPTKPSVHQSIRCDICKVSCTSDKCFDKHVAGKQHQKNLKFSEITPTAPCNTSIQSENGRIENGKIIWCEPCGVSCTSPGMFNEHISGKKHQKKLKKYKEQRVSNPAHVAKSPAPEPVYEEGEIVFSEKSKRKATSEENEDTKRQKMDEEVEKGVVFW